jgi:deazaflavin-dependent oxidoreductase (nitroreductase family)
VTHVVDLSSRPAPTAFSECTGLLGVRVMESINISLFRLSKGKVGGTIFGHPVILLNVSGRTTGRRYTKPLLAGWDDEHKAWIVVASRGGTTNDPQWFTNLMAYRADPTLIVAPTVESQAWETTTVSPESLTGNEYTTWWAAMAAIYPKFNAYDARTNRDIPIVRLTPDGELTPH